MDGEGRGRGKGEKIFTTLPPFFSLVLTVGHPLRYKLISLPSLPLPLKSKMAAIIFVKKYLSIRSPKLRLLCGLTIKRNLINYKMVQTLLVSEKNCLKAFLKFYADVFCRKVIGKLFHS